MRFYYELTGKGWAESEIEINGKTAKTTASYYCDCFYYFIHTIIELNKSEGVFKTGFDEEPGTFEWIFTRTGENVEVTIIWHYEDEPETLINETTTLKELTESIYNELDRLHKKWGAWGYKNEWMCRFPLKLKKELKRYLRRKRKNVLKKA